MLAFSRALRSADQLAFFCEYRNGTPITFVTFGAHEGDAVHEQLSWLLN